MYIVQESNVLYNNITSSAICEGLVFIHIWKALHDRLISLKEEVCAP